ncbi:MAG: hypothetical protein K8R23_09755 [Chthoniobacter sp.]|nr:hypothetical protein [Chthoniobacter sp.]
MHPSGRVSRKPATGAREFLTIDTASPALDERALAVAGQPEPWGAGGSGTAAESLSPDFPAFLFAETGRLINNRRS